MRPIIIPLQHSIRRYSSQLTTQQHQNLIPTIAVPKKNHPFVSSSSSSSFSTSTSTTTTTRPLIELREYQLHPSHSTTYLTATSQTASLRRQLTPLRLFTLPDLGGQLHVATHFYYYEGGLSQRDEKRGVMGTNKAWMEYLKEVRPCVSRQDAGLYVEAGELVEKGLMRGFAALPTASAAAAEEESSSPPPSFKNVIYEMRRYKLILGYDTIPQFLSHYSYGLPSKIATNDPSTSLITVLSTEVGLLNEVIEIWRHGDGVEGMERSRLAAREAAAWREAIGKIAGLAVEFRNVIHKPTGFSPLQ